MEDRVIRPQPETQHSSTAPLQRGLFPEGYIDLDISQRA